MEATPASFPTQLCLQGTRLPLILGLSVPDQVLAHERHLLRNYLLNDSTGPAEVSFLVHIVPVG